jgi:DNA polymerase-1
VDQPENVHVFRDVHKNPEAFLAFAKTVTLWIGHNFIGYDYYRVLKPIINFNVPLSSILDTLVVSRLLNTNIEGGHSIEAWAHRLGGMTKVGAEITDWSEPTPLMEERCINDTLVNLRLYTRFLRYVGDVRWSEAISLEQQIAELCVFLHEVGFPFKKEEALVLQEKLAKRLYDLDEELKAAFPPVPKIIKVLTPRATRFGTINRTDFRWYNSDDLSAFTVDAPFSLVEWEEFNPASPKQIIERLNAAGWKPTEKTKGHSELLKELARNRGRSNDGDKERLERFKTYGWTVSEDNLRTLPDTAPSAARTLVERLLLSSRVSDLEEWIALAKPAKCGWKIHGTFTGIGAWTHRMAHSKPNTANTPIPQHKDNPSRLDVISDEINTEMRTFWYAPKGFRMIGTDADGIQMRIFAHYVNDPKLTDALIKGDKKNETDIHSVHKRALGEVCKGRNPAKTFIYAWLLGAGIAKVAQILECSNSEARDAIESFIRFYPGLQELKEHRIPKDAARGYFEGLDKRLVVCDNEHLMLGGYLQNGEQCIMKRANILWRKWADELKLPYWQINFVHDEYQTLVPDDDEIAEAVAKLQRDAIVAQGIKLNLNCPLAANSKMGYSWMDTH